jgi:hypothetical protein
MERVSRALMVEIERTVNVKTGTVRLDNKFCQADARLAGTRVKVRFTAGETEHVEIWQNQQLLQLAKQVLIPTKIDFSRKPERTAEEPGIAYEGSKNYCRNLTRRANRDKQIQPESIRDYVTEADLAALFRAALMRELTELE